MPDVSYEEAENLLFAKAMKFARMLQKAAYPLAVIFIMLGFIIMMFSIFKLKLVWVGLVAIFVEVIAYTGIMYAPLILEVCYNWFKI